MTTERAADRGPATADEAALVEALRRREEWSYEQLVRQHAGRMTAVAQRVLGNPDEARDAVQEALISVFRSIGSFQEHARLSTWLHRITVNAALMRLRSRRRRPDVAMEDLLPSFYEDGHRKSPLPAWTATTDELLERRETADAIRRTIERLPEDYRDVVMLRDIAEMSTDEAAGLLGISAGAVKTRLHRARQALRTLLERELLAHPTRGETGATP